MSSFSSVSVPDPVADAQKSLEERMAQANKTRREVTTENFPVPGWSDFIWVRLKALSHKLQRNAVDRNQRVRPQATQDMYIAADMLVAATEGFLEVKLLDDGEEELVEYPTSWLEIARVVYGMVEATPRQAIIRTVGVDNIVIFYGQYIQWLTGERERIQGEQAEDFPATQSS
jgi:hypothetical protein